MQLKFKSSLYASIMVVLFALTLPACEEKNTDYAVTDFDRKAMLENIGNNLIIPAYQSLKMEVAKLDTAIKAFNSTPDQSHLSQLHSAFLAASVAWQYVSMYEFGPAEQYLLRTNVNTFPVDTAQVISNISSGSYDLGTAANMDAKGFAALDYLLHGNNNASVLAAFNGPEALKRKQYLVDIHSDLKTYIDNVYNGWVTGNYITTFINSTGTSVGSSAGMLVNQLNFDFEVLKNFCIGIPLGKKTLGSPLPEKVEAYYSGISARLALEHMKAIENLYLGRSLQGIDGTGLDEYLVHLRSQYNGGSLSSAVKAQISSAVNKLQALPDPLSHTIATNPSLVDAAYLELQKLVVLFKTDMPSAMGILITYQDNDGD